MRKLTKNKKKKGFTLIEMVAVVAIIGILAAILVPKVTEYMNDAKKTKVVGQARMVNLAIETAVAKGEGIKNEMQLTGGSGATELPTTAVTVIQTYMELDGQGDNTFAKQFDKGGSLDKLSKTMTVGQCKAIADGAEFEIKSDGSFNGMKQSEEESN